MASSLSVESIYDEWVASSPSDAPPRDRTQRRACLKAVHECRSAAIDQVHEQMKAPSAADWAWLLSALTDTDALAVEWDTWHAYPRIRFAAVAISDIPQLPPETFAMLVRAAVYDMDLSGPRFFIDPCSSAFGAARTTNAIVDYLESGTDFEKAGAAFALYHAFFRFMNPSPIESEATLGSASRRALMALLRAFLQNEDLHVLRATASTLGLFQAEGYPAELRDRVVAAGWEHADEYVRWCIRSWTGTREGNPPECPPRPRARTTAS